MPYEIQRVFVDLNHKTTYDVHTTKSNIQIPIIYDDNHIIVAVKGPGILSQSDSSSKPDMLTLLKEYIKEKYSKEGNVFLGLVHRLDCPVSGVMVFAKTSKAASRISEQIRNRTVEKKYLTVVDGVPAEPSGRLVDCITKHTDNNIAKGSDDGKESSLTYRMLAVNTARDKSLLEIVLETGRTHQIRFQLAQIGNPVSGDRKYGTNPKLLTDRHADNDIPLFSYSFSFKYPTRDLIMKFEVIPEAKGQWKGFEEYFHQGANHP